MKLLTITSIFILSCMFVISCSKTNYEQESKPYTSIESFFIEDQLTGKERLEGVISADSIIIYWNANVAMPSTVTPTIQVASGASMSPASGTAVAFSEETSYTVTAENGTAKVYHLKVKTQRELPILTAVVASISANTTVDQLVWNVAPTAAASSAQYLYLLGEYLLASGNTDNIKVYMQRLHDGYEFDLPLVASTATNTSIQVELPKFNSQLDTGRHRIWIKVGDLTSDSKDIFMRQPDISSNATVTASLAEAGADVKAGQTLNIAYKATDNLGGAITRYYDLHNLHGIDLTVRMVERIDTTINPRTGAERYTYTYKNGSFLITDLTTSAEAVQFKLPEELEEFVGGTLINVSLVYNYMNKDGVLTYLSGNTVMPYGSYILFSTSFTAGINPVTGLQRQATIVSKG